MRKTVLVVTPTAADFEFWRRCNPGMARAARHVDRLDAIQKAEAECSVVYFADWTSIPRAHEIAAIARERGYGQL